MSEPATEAGRRLLEDSGPYVITGEHSLVERILAIEQEARADLAARIVAAVEGLPHLLPEAWLTRPDGEWLVPHSAVLRAIRGASDDRA